MTVSFTDILRWSVFIFIAVVVVSSIIFIFVVFSVVSGGAIINRDILDLAVSGATVLFSILIFALIAIIVLVYIPNILRERED